MKENFDDIIRRRWEAKPFPIDDAHRQEMARMLEGDKKRRGGLIWWFGGLAIALLIGGALWIKEAPQAKAEVKTEVKTEETYVDSKQNESVPAKVESTQQGSKVQGKEVEEGSRVEMKTGVSKTKNAKDAESNSGSKKAVSSPMKSSKNKHPQTEAKIKAQEKDIKKTEKTMVANEIPNFSNISKKEKTIAKNEMPIELKKEGEAPAGGYKVELENPNQVTLLSKEASIHVFPDSIEYDPWTNAIYHDGTVRSLNMTKPLDALSINEVESIMKNVPGAITPHTKITHPVYFIAETGLGFVLASKPVYDGGIKFNVGGGLGMKWQPRVHLQLTGGYLMQDGGFDFERNSTVTTYSFGVRSQFNSLRPDRLHFIYGKFGAAYRFQRSTLDAHIGIQWLYGAQGDITVNEINQVPSEVTRYTWLSTDGLRKTQWCSDVSYGYMLLPKLYLHGGATFYFTDLTEAPVAGDGYDWNGKTAAVQPFITLNYLLHANF